MVLREYLARMDSQDPERALDLLEPDFRFLIALPAGERGGSCKADFAGYIAGRAAVDRVHEIHRYAVDANLETAYGFVVEAGVPVGAFLSAAVVTPAGRMARYQSFFTTSFALLSR